MTAMPHWISIDCQQRHCTCHDRTAAPYFCSSCGCRPTYDHEEETLGRDALDREGYALLASIDHVRLYARRLREDTGTDPFSASQWEAIEACARVVEDALFYDPNREERQEGGA